jgi:hypothetical protein
MRRQRQQQQRRQPPPPLQRPEARQQEREHHHVVVRAHGARHQQQRIPQPGQQRRHCQRRRRLRLTSVIDQPAAHPCQHNGQDAVCLHIAQEHKAGGCTGRALACTPVPTARLPQERSHARRRRAAGIFPKRAIGVNVVGPGEITIEGALGELLRRIGQRAAPFLCQHAAAEEIVEDVVRFPAGGDGHQDQRAEQPARNNDGHQAAVRAHLCRGLRCCMVEKQAQRRHVEQDNGRVDRQMQQESGNRCAGQLRPVVAGQADTLAERVAQRQAPCVKARRAQPQEGEPPSCVAHGCGWRCGWQCVCPPCPAQRLHLTPQNWQGHGAGPALSTAARSAWYRSPFQTAGSDSSNTFPNTMLLKSFGGEGRDAAGQRRAVGRDVHQAPRTHTAAPGRSPP